METHLTDLIRHKGSSVFSVSPTTNVELAAEKMKRHKIGALLVLDDDKQLLGIFTERDVLTKIVANRLNPAKVAVHSIMTEEVVVIEPHRTVREAMQIVTEKKLRHLPIVENGELVGMLSGGDLTRSIVSEAEGFIDTLYEYIHGGYPA